MVRIVDVTTKKKTAKKKAKKKIVKKKKVIKKKVVKKVRHKSVKITKKPKRKVVRKKEEIIEPKIKVFPEEANGASWASPKKSKKEVFDKPVKGKSAATWASPKGKKKEEFKPVKEFSIKYEKNDASWASPKKSKKEEFGEVGLGIEKHVSMKPKKARDTVKTGIPGLDSILEGGIPRGNLVAISGGPGSGKTILSLQFIYNGAKKFNEPGVFISLEEEPERLIETAESFGWDLRDLIKKGKIVILKSPMYKFNVLKSSIRETISRINAKRLVIDPGALLDLFFDRPIEVRKAIVELGSMLKKTGCTSFVTTEEKGNSSFSQTDFSSDGIIFTYYMKMANQFMRMIAVIKMRGSGHSEKIHPLRFTKKGLEVMYGEEVFQDVVSKKF